MTEAEWLGPSDPKPMLASLYGKASPRKMRLAAVGCCRRVAHLLPADERCRLAMEAAERFADRRLTRRELAAAHAGADAARVTAALSARDCRREAAFLAAQAVYWASHPTSRYYPAYVTDNARNAVVWSALPPEAVASQEAFELSSDHEAAGAAERVAQVDLLRCVFGNPFRPPAVSPSWLTWDSGTVPRLARAAYDNRTLPAGTLDNDRLAVLADALEEAGCEDAEVLGHLRGPGPHARGCWPVDALLGKA